ncbi:MFS transporter [Nocardia brasiliensis]
MDAKLRKAVRCLGVSQLVCWGVTYYLVGIFGGSIGADLGWSETRVQGGFSVALVVMGGVSPLVGHCIDRFGGRPVLATGSVLAGLGCAGVATTSTVGWYYLSWIVLGAAMRCTLYDAAFATLARLGGGHAKRPMSQITLLGGLASTVFWPIGHGLAEVLGWRGALLVYAGFALSTLRGIAQSAARLGDVLFGRDMAAPDLNLISLALLLFSFLVGFGGGRVLLLAAACATLYGAGNGLATITRGTLPLALFPAHGYGARVGRLLLPSFLLSAAAPLVYAVVLESYGATGALTLSAVLSAGMAAAGFALRRRARAMAANSATVSQM